MKRSIGWLVAAWGLCAAVAPAQDIIVPAQPVTYEAYSYYDLAGSQPSPSDQPAVADKSIQAQVQAPAEAAPTSDRSCCGLFGHAGQLGPLCHMCWPCGCQLSDLGEAHKIWQPCCPDSQWSMNGWLAQSFTWNPYNPTDRFNGPVTWTDRSNEYQMNELWLGGGRVTKTDGCGWDWGGRVDAFYGTNYRWDTSAGFETHSGNGAFYGYAVPNLYAEGAYNNWTVKLGRFISPVGYYTVGTAQNFFPVIPYTYQYGEPFTHTGIWAQNKLSDQWTVGAAVTHGWDDTDNTGNPHAGGLLNATWTIDQQRSLAWVGVIGNEPNLSGVNTYAFNGTGYTARYFQTLVYTRKFSDSVMGVLQSDFGTQHDAVVAGQTAKWYGINSYLYWNMTCRCQWGANAEWFRDQGGFRVGQVLPSFGSPNARGLARGPGYDGSFYRFTFGPRYYWTPNFYSRVAFLADWYDGKQPAGGRPFDAGTKNYQQILVMDAVLTY